jgi:hypothetical protein
MRTTHVPGRPITSTQPRRLPRRIAPANKQADKVRAGVAGARQGRPKEQGGTYSERVIAHLEEVAEAHRKRKRAGPSALDPILAEETPMKKAKGNSKNNKLTQLLKLSALAIMSHPYGDELARWDQGVAVDCGDEWSREAIDLAVAHGPHPTAQAAEAIDLVHEDIAYQVEAGFTKVVYWEDIKDDLPEHFKVSPVAVIPQTGRRGRIILDLSFPVRKPPHPQSKRRMGETVAESVNDTTRKLAPQGPVHAIGQVLPRLFHFMASTPPEQEIRLS